MLIFRVEVDKAGHHLAILHVRYDYRRKLASDISSRKQVVTIKHSGIKNESMLTCYLNLCTES